MQGQVKEYGLKPISFTFTTFVTANFWRGVESGVRSKILDLLKNKDLSKAEIAQGLGKAKPSRYLNDLIRSMLTEGIIEYTIPEKPNSRLQKYRISMRVSG